MLRSKSVTGNRSPVRVCDTCDRFDVCTTFPEPNDQTATAYHEDTYARSFEDAHQLTFPPNLTPGI